MALISGYACDNCHEMVLYDDSFFSRWEKPPTKIYLARKDGWSVGKRGVLCPNCRVKAWKKMPQWHGAGGDGDETNT